MSRRVLSGERLFSRARASSQAHLVVNLWHSSWRPAGFGGRSSSPRRLAETGCIGRPFFEAGSDVTGCSDGLVQSSQPHIDEGCIRRWVSGRRRDAANGTRVVPPTGSGGARRGGAAGAAGPLLCRDRQQHRRGQAAAHAGTAAAGGQAAQRQAAPDRQQGQAASCTGWPELGAKR